jgi:hypothetical protein
LEIEIIAFFYERIWHRRMDGFPIKTPCLLGYSDGDLNRTNLSVFVNFNKNYQKSGYGQADHSHS